MQRYARFTLALALPLSLCSTRARADAPERTGLALSALPALDSFVQEDGAPPLCCGERDHWTARGPAFSLRAGYFLARWIEPALDLGVAWRSAHVDDGARALDVSMRATAATLGLYFPLGTGRFALEPGVFLRTGTEHSVFTLVEQSARTTHTIDDSVSAPGIALGADVLLTTHLAVGAFARGDLPGQSQVTFALGLAVTWYGVDR